MSEDLSVKPAGEFSRFEQRIEAFEAAWRLEQPPVIADWLTHENSISTSLIPSLAFELIAIDLEHRWRGTANISSNDILGCQPRVSAYAAEFTLLGPIAGWPAWLVAKEYRARIRWGDLPSADRFIAEYPEHVTTLASLLPALARELAADGALTKPRKWSASTKPDPRAPLALTDYVLEQHLGTGGMGKVFRATQRSLQRTVAVKALLKSRQNDPQAVERFLQEARLLGQLSHPNIVGVHGLGRFPGGGFFLVMDFVEGQDLAARIRTAPMTIPDAARITSQVAEAIQHAHEQGVIHCDLKPANVLLSKTGRPYVADFGFAQLVTNQSLQTAGVGGTAGYMAPEQMTLTGEAITTAVDIYGLGALLYSLLANQPPIDIAKSAEGRRLLDQEIRPINQLRADVPKILEEVCQRCLRPRPAERYARRRCRSSTQCRIIVPIVSRRLSRQERLKRSPNKRRHQKEPR